jgi:tungstate transport system ATP-binding protein
MNDVAPNSALPIVLAGTEICAGGTRILGPVSLILGRGPPTVVIGPNGSGKTTLLRAAMGLMPLSGGGISWAGQTTPPVHGRAIVFQRPVMLRRSCAANLRYALHAAGVSGAECDRRMTHLLQLVGLTPVAERPARKLSGGEQQRLALARALARRPTVIFLDEPTASLDPAATKAIEDLIRTIAQSGVKVVMATHDLGEARRLAGDVILLHRGELVESGPAERIFAAPATAAAQQFLAGELLV